MYVKKYKSKTLKGKLRVSRYLSADSQLNRYVPRAASFSRNNIEKMADQYKSLYIKPNIGSQGIGIYKMKRVSDGYELYSTYKKKQHRRHFKSLLTLYRHVAAKKHHMFIQRGISLDQVNGRPYDIRVMVQRKPGKPWTCTGLMAKVGAPKRIVTNYYQGGKIYTIGKLLKLKGFSPAKRESRIASLSKTAVKVSRKLSAMKSGMHEMGIDFAYDTKQRLWILEVNSNHPQFHPLKKLDRAAYDRMRSYARSYGRYDS